jgi:hypothetical protein
MNKLRDVIDSSKKLLNNEIDKTSETLKDLKLYYQDIDNAGYDVNSAVIAFESMKYITLTEDTNNCAHELMLSLYGAIIQSQEGNNNEQ